MKPEKVVTVARCDSRLEFAPPPAALRRRRVPCVVPMPRTHKHTTLFRLQLSYQTLLLLCVALLTKGF
jgi:hypothetical protein